MAPHSHDQTASTRPDPAREDGAHITACASLALSLDQALLVSSPELETAALELEERLTSAASAGRGVGTFFSGVATTSDGTKVLDRNVQDLFGKTLDDYVDDLQTALTDADRAANELISEVRGVLLQTD